MDEERVTQIGEASMLPDGARWGDIRDLSGEALNAAYVPAGGWAALLRPERFA